MVSPGGPGPSMALSVGEGHCAAGSPQFHDKMHTDAVLPVTMESLSGGGSCEERCHCPPSLALTLTGSMGTPSWSSVVSVIITAPTEK